MALVEFALWMSMLLALAAGVIVCGYFAYAARVAREEMERRPKLAPVDHVAELRRVNVLIEQRAREATLVAGRARDAVQRQTRG